MNQQIQAWQGDCLDLMKRIPAGSVDMVFCDPPYGMTSLEWDKPLPFKALWDALHRIGKPNCAFIFTGSQPFTSDLITSNRANFKTEWIYAKQCGTGFAATKNHPLRQHENVIVFCREKPDYVGIPEERQGGGLVRSQYERRPEKETNKHAIYGGIEKQQKTHTLDALRVPSSIQLFNNKGAGVAGFHKTPKPPELLMYLIRTYTDPDMLVVDPTAGGMTTGVACKMLQRRCICIEKDPAIFKVGAARLERPVNVDMTQIHRDRDWWANRVKDIDEAAKAESAKGTLI